VSETLLLSLAALWAFAGMAWCALAMEAHWQQVTGTAQALPRARRHGLRLAGTLGLLASLALCLMADHATMAALVWVMLLTLSAFVVAMLLSWRPQVLRGLLHILPFTTSEHPGLPR
jgi:Protein of unknown function (DUF3325)